MDKNELQRIIRENGVLPDPEEIEPHEPYLVVTPEEYEIFNSFIEESERSLAIEVNENA